MTAAVLALAGGSFVFLGFLVLFGFAIVFAYYSRTGSDISMRPFGDRGDRDTSAFSDTSQDVRNWTHGTGGSHRRSVPKVRRDATMESALDRPTREALRAWRARLSSGASSGLVGSVDGRRDHIRGPGDAEVTVVNYSDFQCGACHQIDAVIRDMVTELGGRVRYVFRHFPLADAHDCALQAAEATEWAAGQGRFWDVHDAIYQAPHEPTVATLRKAVAGLGMDAGELGDALRAETFRARVAEDFASGVRSGANGTPSLFINGVRHDDDFDPATLRAAVMAAMGAG